MSTRILKLANRRRHNGGMNPEELRAAITRYDETTEHAKEERDNTIRRAKEDGMTQTEIVKATGYTRETIRRILKPEAAEAVRRAAAERRAQQKEAS